MSDARVDHIEETLSSLGQKVDGLSLQLHETTDRLDGRIDALALEMKAGFEHTQAAFDDHRRYAEFLTQGVREDMSVRFNRVERRFDAVDERFDRMSQGVEARFDSVEKRFDRLEKLIKER